ncbi:MAG: TonB family protein [Acidobacteria bacterium]|nr:TonB family protein [Acidobacteriota bacterium]
MRATAAAFIALLFLNSFAGAQTQAPAGSEELQEAARLDAEVVNLFGRGKYDEAAPLAERVLEIRLKAFGPAHPGVADAQYNLGMVRIGQGKFAEAEAVLRQALAVYEQAPPAADPARAKVLAGLALARVRQGHEDEALKLSAAALAAAEQAFGVEGKEVADYSRQLADLYRLKGDYGKAEAAYLRAIKIWTVSAGRDDARVETAVERLMCMAADNRRRVGPKVSDLLDEIDPVKGIVLNGKAISKPAPSYPAEAKSGGIQGGVVVKVWVDETGAVTRLNAVCGHPVLAKASVEAARRARFSVTTLDGKPAKVTGYITYNFVLR